MITKLVLHNFQPWREANIQPGPFTAIIGPTGYGKSSILRALKALVDLAPGHAHVRHGASHYQVGLVVDGQQVVWAKGKSVNRAVLNDQLFDKLGRTLPEEVKTLLNLPILDLDGTSLHLWYAQQFDPPLLVLDSAPQAARTLMAATGIARLTEVQKAMARDRKTSATNQALLSRQTSDLHSSTSALARAKGLLAYRALEPKIQRYRLLHAQREELRVHSPPPTPQPPINFPAGVEAKLAALRQRRSQLPSPVPEPSPRILVPDPVRLISAITIRSDYRKLREEMGRTYLRILSLEVEAKLAEKKLHEAVGSICPLCGQALQ